VAQKSVTWKSVDRLISAGAANAELAAKTMVAMVNFISNVLDKDIDWLGSRYILEFVMRLLNDGTYVVQAKLNIYMFVSHNNQHGAQEYTCASGIQPRDDGYMSHPGDVVYLRHDVSVSKPKFGRLDSL
jgi:hypothetical protein